MNRSLSLCNAYAARRVGLVVGGRGETKSAVLQAHPEVVEQPSSSAVKALLLYCTSSFWLCLELCSPDLL